MKVTPEPLPGTAAEIMTAIGVTVRIAIGATRVMPTGIVARRAQLPDKPVRTASRLEYVATIGILRAFGHCPIQSAPRSSQTTLSTCKEKVSTRRTTGTPAVSALTVYMTKEIGRSCNRATGSDSWGIAG